MQKSALLLQRLAQSRDPVTSLRARQLLVRFRRVAAAKSLILPRLVDLSYHFTKLPGTIEAMGIPDIGGVPIQVLVQQSRVRTKKVWDLFEKGDKAQLLAGRYDGSHQPERADNLRKGAERLKALAIESFEDAVAGLSWVRELPSLVSDGTPEAKKWVFHVTTQVKLLESALRNLDSVL